MIYLEFTKPIIKKLNPLRKVYICKLSIAKQQKLSTFAVKFRT